MGNLRIRMLSRDWLTWMNYPHWMIRILALGVWYDNFGFWGEVSSLIKLVRVGQLRKFLEGGRTYSGKQKETEETSTNYVRSQTLSNLKFNCYDASVERMEEYSLRLAATDRNIVAREGGGPHSIASIPTRSARVQYGSQYWLAIGAVWIPQLIRELRIKGSPSVSCLVASEHLRPSR